MTSVSHPACGTAHRLFRRAFTLPELLIAIAVFGFENKLTASAGARKSLGKVVDDIRNCKTTYVGNVSSNGVFTALADGVPQSGGALVIYPTTNAASFIVYFLNMSDKTFRRTVSVSNTTSTIVLASSVTNSVLFNAEDFRGNIVTNSQNNRVICVAIECYQPRRFGVVADYYKLETAVTRRALQ